MENLPGEEEILTRFHDWLEETRVESESLDGDSAAEPWSGEPVGLYQVVEQLTALRHDVKLAAKATRGLEEGTEATRLSLQAAVEQFRAVEAKEKEAADRAARPLVEAVAELDESLIRGRRAIEQAKRRVLEGLHGEMRELRERLEALYKTQPWWRRRLCRPWHEAMQGLHSERTLGWSRSVFDSLLEGYDLIEKRLRRLMEEQSIVRMQCLGEPADPKRMTVLEVVSDPSRPPGTVIEEVRPGYCWKGRVLRFAEVRAVGEQ